ncbi:MAG: BT4734/BF3469 family protein [Bacteroides cellulosilyticus]
MTLDIRQHLTANDIATADFIKGELPSVTFSARFIGGRRYDKLIEYNGEIPIDLDKKTPEELARISAGRHEKSVHPYQFHQSERQRL